MKLQSLFVAALAAALATTAQAQVKVGSNPASITTNAVLDAEGTSGQHTVILQNGNMGVNQTAPTNQLHVRATSNPLRLEGLQTTTSSSGTKVLVADNNGVVQLSQASSTGVISVGLRSTFTASRQAAGTFNNFANSSLNILNINTIPGASFNLSTGVVTLPSGTYLISFSVDASIATGGGTDPNNSYFYDFPNGSGSNARVHFNQVSNAGTNSNHGGTLVYVTRLTSTQNLPFGVGWGQGGNQSANSEQIAFGAGTQLSIVRLAD